MDKLKITVLVDNYVNRAGLLAEHGLSVLIEKGPHVVLFDTGQSGILIKNARSLGVDIRKIGSVVLSHGHFDHCGGLMDILKELKKEIDVYAHPAIFEQKYKKGAQGPLYIGLPFKKQEYEANGANFILSDQSLDLFEGGILTGQIPRLSDIEVIEDYFLKKEKGRYFKDGLLDDNSLIIGNGSFNVLITGCAHSGILNILERSAGLAPKRPLTILGGMHLSEKGGDHIRAVVRGFLSFDIKDIVSLHCSGPGFCCAYNNTVDKGCLMGQVGYQLEFD
jgi:7,8-dihydropterin-6-yl-methyl-4-(beta-D-ribofuranosyl)aminobenzene 5'-phosphate synthase